MSACPPLNQATGSCDHCEYLEIETDYKGRKYSVCHKQKPSFVDEHTSEVAKP